MKKGDWIIILCSILLALLPLAALLAPAAAPDAAVVRINGRIVRTLPLDTDARIEFPANGGVNTVAIQDGAASIVYADCPDKTCAAMGDISSTNEMLVCLPHHLTVTIEGMDSALDAVTQ